jgi:hypothetical protein
MCKSMMWFELINCNKTGKNQHSCQCIALLREIWCLIRYTTCLEFVSHPKKKKHGKFFLNDLNPQKSMKLCFFDF